MNPSSCVKAHESRYLIDGTLPPAGTTCRPPGQIPGLDTGRREASPAAAE
ncbi:hypothetical protein [Streptomyces sp. NPDC000994]